PSPRCKLVVPSFQVRVPYWMTFRVSGPGTVHPSSISAWVMPRLGLYATLKMTGLRSAAQSSADRRRRSAAALTAMAYAVRRSPDRFIDQHLRFMAPSLEHAQGHAPDRVRVSSFDATLLARSGSPCQGKVFVSEKFSSDSHSRGECSACRLRLSTRCAR